MRRDVRTANTPTTAIDNCSRPKVRARFPLELQGRKDTARDTNEDARTEGVSDIERGGVAALLGCGGQAHHCQRAARSGKPHPETGEDPSDGDQEVRKHWKEGDQADQGHPDGDRGTAQRDQPVAPYRKPWPGLQPGTDGPANGANGEYRAGLQQRNGSLLDQHQRHESFSAEECAGEKPAGLHDLRESAPKPQESWWHQRWQRHQKTRHTANR